MGVVRDEFLDEIPGKPPERPARDPGRWLAPCLAAAGPIGWCVVALGVRAIWGGHDPEGDVLGISWLAHGLMALVFGLVGVTVFLTLMVVGGVLSLARLARIGPDDVPGLVGVAIVALAFVVPPLIGALSRALG